MSSLLYSHSPIINHAFGLCNKQINTRCPKCQHEGRGEDVDLKTAWSLGFSSLVDLYSLLPQGSSMEATKDPSLPPPRDVWTE